MVCLHNISPFSWKYYSYMHRVCKRCGKMEFLDTAYGLMPYWYDWLTVDDCTLKNSGITFPQPKTVEGFIAEAKVYDAEANQANLEEKKEKEEQKQKEQKLKLQAKNLITTSQLNGEKE